MHDTLKKPKDILTASYAVRFPEKALKSRTLVREVDVDPQVSFLQSSSGRSSLTRVARQALESDRQRLLAIERLILETICFNFTSKMPFPLVIKFGRYFNGSPLASSHCARWSLTPFPLSLKAVDEIRVASCCRRLPDTRTANVSTSRSGVGVPLSRSAIDDL